MALHTWGGEEGPGEPLVSGNVSDICGDVDESTDHRGDSVKAQHSVTWKGKYYMLAQNKSLTKRNSVCSLFS